MSDLHDAIEAKAAEWDRFGATQWVAELREVLAAHPRPAPNDDVEDDLLGALRLRNAALKEAALDIQPGPDGQDYIDRERMVCEWIERGRETLADDPTAGDLGYPVPRRSLVQWANEEPEE